MRAGAPPCCTEPALALLGLTRAGDAVMRLERWSGGLRLRIHGTREDDAAYCSDTTETILSPADIGALRGVLSTGEDASLTVEAWGRTYRHTYSLQPPSDLWEDGECVWFYPMSASRMTLRIAAEPLRAALQMLLGEN